MSAKQLLLQKIEHECFASISCIIKGYRGEYVDTLCGSVEKIIGRLKPRSPE